jgi:hypothetical protein
MPEKASIRFNMRWLTTSGILVSGRSPCWRCGDDCRFVVTAFFSALGDGAVFSGFLRLLPLGSKGSRSWSDSAAMAIAQDQQF